MARERKKKMPRKGGNLETLKTFLFAVAIALLIRTFFVQAFRIPSGSMEDTLLVGDFLLVDKVTYGAVIPGTKWRLPGFRDPHRGDIIVFKDPRTNRDFIKRVIATGGEEIRLEDNEVWIDGRRIPEPYKMLKQFGGHVRSSFDSQRVPENSLFMMGDNRNNSQDSRYWGCLDDRRVVGRAFVLYFSTDPGRAPAWVRNMSEGWTKGFLQLVLGRPRITRLGKWLATDYSEIYAQGVEPAAEAPAGARSGAPGAVEAAEVAPGDATTAQ